MEPGEQPLVLTESTNHSNDDTPNCPITFTGKLLFLFN